MYALVRPQATSLIETLITLFAMVWLFSGVDTPVFPQVGYHTERLVTVFATERSLLVAEVLRMCLQIPFQTIFSTVETLVCPEIYQPTECLVTVFTVERFFSMETQVCLYTG